MTTLTQFIQNKKREFDEKFPCKNTWCDNDGSIAVQVGEGEYEQDQCQWCDEVRLPAKNFLESSLREVVEEYRRETKDDARTAFVKEIRYFARNLESMYGRTGIGAVWDSMRDMADTIEKGSRRNGDAFSEIEKKHDLFVNGN